MHLIMTIIELHPNNFQSSEIYLWLGYQNIKITFGIYSRPRKIICYINKNYNYQIWKIRESLMFAINKIKPIGNIGKLTSFQYGRILS